MQNNEIAMQTIINNMRNLAMTVNTNSQLFGLHMNILLDILEEDRPGLKERFRDEESYRMLVDNIANLYRLRKKPKTMDMSFIKKLNESIEQQRNALIQQGKEDIYNKAKREAEFITKDE